MSYSVVTWIEKGKRHHMGSTSLGPMWIRLNAEYIIIGLYTCFEPRTQKFLPTEGMTIDEAKEELELQYEIEIEAIKLSQKNRV